MAKIIAIANQKGGVGKTTTTINLAAYVAVLGYRSLIIDFDPQGNATSGLGIDKQTVENSSYEILINQLPAEQAILSTDVNNLSVIPASIALAGAEIELVPMVAREHMLIEALQPILSDYDFIFVDCPPSLGLLTLNAFTAANSVVVPIQCEYFALEGLSQLINTIQLLKRRLNPSLEIEGFVLTMYDGRTNLSNQVVKEVQKHFSAQVYRTVIPRSIRLGEAPSYGQTIVEYAPQSSAGQAYHSLAQEFIAHNGGL